jgi:hypothetical protein
VVDWEALTADVKHDAEIARNAKVGDPVGIAASNKLWEVDKKKL